MKIFVNLLAAVSLLSAHVSVAATKSPFQGSIDGLATSLNGVYKGSAGAMAGSIVAVNGLAVGAGEIGAASKQAVENALVFAKELTIKAYNITAEYVEITYTFAKNVADEAIEFTIKIGKQAMKDALALANKTLEYIQEGVKVTIETIHYIVDNAPVVVGHTMMLAGDAIDGVGKGFVSMGAYLNDQGQKIAGENPELQ